LAVEIALRGQFELKEELEIILDDWRQNSLFSIRSSRNGDETVIRFQVAPGQDAYKGQTVVIRLINLIVPFIDGDLIVVHCDLKVLMRRRNGGITLFRSPTESHRDFWGVDNRTLEITTRFTEVARESEFNL
jgi:hypothetical protein